MVDTFTSAQGKDYIFASDTMAAVGLSQLLENNREVIIKIVAASDISADLENFDGEACERLIVYLPRDPASVLLALKKTAVYLRQPEAPDEVLIITPYAFNWLYHTLRSQVSPDLIRKVIAIDSAVSLKDIAEQLTTLPLRQDCLPIQARREEIATGDSMVGMTQCEYDCVLDFFCGRSVQEPLYSQKDSAISTRYSQRNAGLRKLKKQLPSTAADIRRKRIELNG